MSAVARAEIMLWFHGRRLARLLRPLVLDLEQVISLQQVLEVRVTTFCSCSEMRLMESDETWHRGDGREITGSIT